jgi:hypothetical protein
MSIAEELEFIKLKLAQAEIMDVCVTEDTLTVDLTDGRTISAPILWFPRLSHGAPEERNNFVLMRDGIHWPELDEDISVKTLLLGRGLGENPQSLQRWLEQRQKAQQTAHQSETTTAMTLPG